jgi:uncharacterized protein with PIN domain
MRAPSLVRSVEVRQPHNNRPSFLADAMLGSVARKLRIYGFDTSYTASIHDDSVLKIAAEQNRIILTCDRELFKRILKKGLTGVLLQSNCDIENIAHLLAKNGICSLRFDQEFSRCAKCNGSLIKKTRDDVKAHLVNLRSLLSQEQFYQCSICNKIYWKGSHLEHIICFAKSIDARINQNTKCN